MHIMRIVWPNLELMEEEEGIRKKEKHTQQTKKNNNEVLFSYLCVVDHVNSLVDNALGMFAEKFENVLHLSLVRETTKTDTILACA